MSINTLLIFEKRKINGALFYDALLVFALLIVATIAWVLLGATKSAILNTFLTKVISPVSTIYASL